MKANELMIGDWVRNDFGENQQIVEIRQDCVMLAYNDTFSLGKIAPIPLTTEILEKNGFKVYEQDFTSNTVYEFGCFDFMEFDRFYKYFNIGSKITYRNLGIEVTCIHSLMRIYFVHELQHALRLCGIEKEITI